MLTINGVQYEEGSDLQAALDNGGTDQVMNVYQLRGTGADSLTHTRRVTINSTVVFKTREDAEGHANQFRRQLDGFIENDDLLQITVIALKLVE